MHKDLRERIIKFSPRLGCGTRLDRLDILPVAIDQASFAIFTSAQLIRIRIEGRALDHGYDPVIGHITSAKKSRKNLQVISRFLLH
jgi:hypothetical protein